MVDIPIRLLLGGLGVVIFSWVCIGWIGLGSVCDQAAFLFGSVSMRCSQALF